MLEPFPGIKGLVEELLSSNPDSRELKKVSGTSDSAPITPNYFSHIYKEK
jgi:hypothetical protein